jgi:hypothetical protein
MYDEVSNTISYSRCTREPRNKPPHGWLCEEHFNTPTKKTLGDDGYTQFLLKTEAEVLKVAPKENLFGLKLIKGLRMTQDPKLYEE